MHWKYWKISKIIHTALRTVIIQSNGQGTDRLIRTLFMGKYLRKCLWELKKKKTVQALFLIIYEYNDLKDLAIGIDILNEEEIKILTVIYKSANRRKHYGN